MITVTKKFEFEAAHWLPGYGGICADMHGHSYKLEVEVRGMIDDSGYIENGMIIDFSELKKVVNEKVINKLDHKIINDLIMVPTAEHMVQWIVSQLISVLNIVRIRLYETSNSYAEWRKE